MGASLLYFSGGNFVLDGASFSGSGKNAVVGGTLQIDTTAVVASNGTLELLWGTITGDGQLTVPGVFNWSSGGEYTNSVMSGSGTTFIASGGQMTIEHPGDGLSLLDSRTLRNEGTLTVDLSSRPWFYGANGATLENLGTLNWVSSGQSQDGEFLCWSSEGRPVLNNSGTINKIGGSHNATINWIVNNSGTINVSAGVLNLPYGIGSGNVYVSGRSSLKFSDTSVSGLVSALSGQELGLRWDGLGTGPGVSYTYEISENGGAYKPFSGERYLNNLHQGTGYKIRVTSTDATGSKRVYESENVATHKTPDQTGERWLIGFADSNGNMVITFEHPVRVFAGSPVSAMLDAVRNPQNVVGSNGTTSKTLITDDSIPKKGYGFALFDAGYGVYSFEPNLYGVGDERLPMVSLDPSAQPSLSHPWNNINALSPVWGNGTGDLAQGRSAMTLTVTIRYAILMAQ